MSNLQSIWPAGYGAEGSTKAHDEASRQHSVATGGERLNQGTGDYDEATNAEGYTATPLVCNVGRGNEGGNAAEIIAGDLGLSVLSVSATHDDAELVAVRVTQSVHETMIGLKTSHERAIVS